MYRVILLAIAVLCLVGARFYHITFHPEWTEAQALLNLWPFWMGGVLAIFAHIKLTT